MNRLSGILTALLLSSCSGSPRFELIDSDRSGIDFQNTIEENDTLNILNFDYLYNGAGIGAGDLNNDGLTDLVFAGNLVTSGIYLNEGNLRFRDITSSFTSFSNDQWYSGVAIADVNSDGWPDVFLTSTSMSSKRVRKNRLWINNGPDEKGNLFFTEESEKYGIAGNDYSVAAAFLDFDLDGNIDLYVMNNVINQEITSAYRPKITDGTSPNNDRLYRNNGDGTFSDVSIKAGIVIEGFGTGLAVSDINKDGWPDIFVSNDMLSNDLLYINQGDGTFHNEAARYLSYQSRASKGNDIADVNNDGLPDILSLDMMPDDYQTLKRTVNGFNYLHYAGDEEFGFEHQYMRNMLHLHNGFNNDGMIPFSEIGQFAGISATDWSWSPLFADLDNDGDKDLFVTNGFPGDIRDKDWTKIKASAAGSLTTELALSEMAPRLKIPNVVFENTGNLRFVRKDDWVKEVPSFSYGAVTADLDNDGDLDIVVNNINDKAFILKNRTVERSPGNSSFIRIKLKGSKGNSMGTGSRIEIWHNGNYQYSENYTARGYASSAEPVIHFGVADSRLIDSLRVTWPGGGKASVLENVAVNTTIEIREQDAENVGDYSPGKRNPGTGSLLSRLENLMDYTHGQDDFNDFALNQAIIPHKFSQIGPCMAKGDIDGDSREDIIAGSSNRQPTKVFLRKGNGFEETVFRGLTTRKQYSESDLAILDTDGDGDNDIVAVAGGYENPDESEYRHILYENREGIFVSHNLPVPSFPASVVRPCDFDHDGDPDLFIGSRVKKGIYPYANHSWVIINKGGTYSADPDFRLNLGMVTDALWSDFDGDGWEDLVVARDWNSVVILKNNNGLSLEPLIIPGLESNHGLWYSLVSADLDLDGDMDLIAGNLGENYRFSPDDDHPLQLYAMDLEPDGTLDPVITAFYPVSGGEMTEYPVNFLDELWSQSPYFEAIIKDYNSFSRMSFSELMKENLRKRHDFTLYVNTTSSYILWNENPGISWERLPDRVQYSPLTRILAKDITNDGLPDLIMAGNDHTWDLASGYFDASKGIVLVNMTGRKGESDQSFELMDPGRSGFVLNGMVTSLLWLEGDTSLIVAGINRSAPAVFEYIKP